MSFALIFVLFTKQTTYTHILQLKYFMMDKNKRRPYVIMKYFCETVLSDKPHFFLSDFQPISTKVKSYKLQTDEIKLRELDRNISIYNSMLTPHNILSIYMMLSEICIYEKEKRYFNRKASEFACKQLETTM